jgi:hypothetical protein
LKKELLTIITTISITCLASSAVFAAALTGNNGDAGDPNNNVVSMAALDAPVTPAPAASAPIVTPVVAPKTSTSEQIASSPNALGDTGNSRAAFAQMVHNIMPLSPTRRKL